MKNLGIETLEDLKENLLRVEEYLNDPRNVDEMKGYIRRGKNFVVYQHNNKFHFAPSRFIGYKNNTLRKHRNNGNKHGWATYNFITTILAQKCSENKEFEQLFHYYCNDLGIKPNNKNRKYWVLENEKTDFHEGGVNQILTNKYERSLEARKKCIELYGTTCKICGFNFKEVYGSIGDGYIHIHHIVPISQQKGQYKLNYAKDLIPVCPNCHAMLHKGDMSVDELRKVIEINKS